MPTSISPGLIKETTRFHGHWCPGLAIGIRAAEYALKEVGKAGDEEIVAVVETDMCGVDAIQFLTGCTFGKGNLIHRDYGKNAFTFYRRRDGKAFRIVARPNLYGGLQQKTAGLHAKMQKQGLTEDEQAAWDQSRSEISERIMDLALDELFEITKPPGPVPKKARIVSTMVCEACGEPVMESRTRRFEEQTLCIPCFEAMENRF